jgi:glycosyltransferase involved in cell wall biosynthesis
MSSPTRLLFLQTGNFRDAFERFARGEPETYHEQKRSVDFVAAMAPAREVTVCAIAPEPHDTRLAPGLRAIGVTQAQMYAPGFGERLLAEVAPDQFVPRLPHVGALRAAIRRRVRTLPCLADIMTRPERLLSRPGASRALTNLRLARLFGDPSVTAVGNHSLLASRSLHEVLGIPRSRIVPWEWSRLELDLPPRRHPGRAGRPALVVYAGKLIEAKGAGDLVEAAILLVEAGAGVRVLLAGEGPDLERYRARVESRGLGERIVMPGRIPKAEVRQAMREADIAVMPSRPDYAEGLPNTVVEGLAHGLPLVVSDHPSVKARLRDGEDCLIARAGDPADLARQLRRYLDEPDLYERIAAETPAAYARLFVGMPWYRLIENFLDDPTDRTGWVAAHSLEAIARDGRDAAPPPRAA